MDLIVKNDSLLLEYLYENIKDKSKNNIKTLLKNGVFVNDLNKLTRNWSNDYYADYCHFTNEAYTVDFFINSFLSD